MRNPILALVFCLAPLTTFGADAFTDAVQQAYPAYRQALFNTNSGAADTALASVQTAQQAWQQIAEQFTGKAPAPYDRDAAFSETLERISRIYAEAEQQARDNRLPLAHETLEAIRDSLADLRQRNQVVVYSDHINAYHAVMEQLLVEGKHTLSQPDGIGRLAMQVGALDYLSEKLQAEAPVQYRQDPAFMELLTALQNSVDDLTQAALKQERVAIETAIGKLKKPYAKLFVKFG